MGEIEIYLDVAECGACLNCPIVSVTERRREGLVARVEERLETNSDNPQVPGVEIMGTPEYWTDNNIIERCINLKQLGYCLIEAGETVESDSDH